MVADVGRIQPGETRRASRKLQPITNELYFWRRERFRDFRRMKVAVILVSKLGLTRPDE